MSYKKVLDDILDTENTTVGGGSAAAISGAMAAGLIGMATRLSMGKGYDFPDEKYRDIVSELEDLEEKLLEGSVEDTKAYLLIRDAFRLPKGTEEEKEIRKKAVNDAGVAAANVPKENAKRCERIVEIADFLEDKYNTNTESDFVIGKNLAFLGLQGCILNIEANLGLIKDEKEKEKFMSYIDRING